MKHWIALLIVILLAVAGVVVAERARVDVSVSPAPLFYLVADTERDLMRVPVTLSPVSDRDEIAIGNRLSRPILPIRTSAQDQLISDYITQVGNALTEHAHRRLLWRFHYLNNDGMVNAFAMPGGHIFMGKGLLELMDTEDELAAVLAHEIEHVELRHCIEREQIQSRLRHVPLGELIDIPVELFAAGYSKEQELDADQEGTRLAVAAGYSASGAIEIFRRFEELESRSGPPRRKGGVAEVPGRIIEAATITAFQEYFRSHPPASLRRARIERMTQEQGWPVGNQKMLRVAYMLRRDRAARYLAAGDLDKAASFAQQALVLDPHYPPALSLAAAIALERGLFADAATLYRSSLDLDAKQPAAIDGYSVSLAAAAPQQAAHRYAEWLAQVPANERTDQILMNDAGLRLLVHEPEPAASLDRRLKGSETGDQPMLRGRLGWWYLRAGDPDTAAQLLEDSLQLRPQEAVLAIDLGYVLIAQKKYETAEARLRDGTASPDLRTRGTAEAALAVISWRARQDKYLAIQHYQNALQASRAWANPAWVSGVYGSANEETLSQVRAEKARRDAALRR